MSYLWHPGHVHYYSESEEAASSSASVLVTPLMNLLYPNNWRNRTIEVYLMVTVSNSV